MRSVPRRRKLRSHAATVPSARGIVRIDLADEKHLVAPTLDRLADQCLAAPLAVHFRGINEPGTQVKREPDGCDLLGAQRCTVADLPRSKAEGGHTLARRQSHCLHRSSPGMQPG